MKSVVGAILALFFCTMLTGMGGIGGAPDGTIPETSEDIRATVTDRQGVKATVNRFSVEGKTFIEGGVGNARMTVDFRHLASIEFGEKNGDTVWAVLNLREGEPVRLQVKRTAVFYGSTGYGTYQIAARDIRRIDFPAP